MFCSEDYTHHRRVVWPWGFGVERVVEGGKGGPPVLAGARILPQLHTHPTSDPRLNPPPLTLRGTLTYPSMRVGYMDPKDVWLSYCEG